MVGIEINPRILRPFAHAKCTCQTRTGICSFTRSIVPLLSTGRHNTSTSSEFNYKLNLQRKKAAAVEMPVTVTKKVLGDSTNAHQNINVMPSAKRRKLDPGSSPGRKLKTARGNNTHLGSSQPKSQFEEEVLEKLSQDISGGKRSNAEKDQQWERPPLQDFDPKRDNLCFQQIEVEEGSLHGGKATVKLFGVTEVSNLSC